MRTIESGKKYLESGQRSSLPDVGDSKRSKRTAKMTDSEDGKSVDKEVHLSRK